MQQLLRDRKRREMTTGAHLLYSLLTASALMFGLYCFHISWYEASGGKQSLMRFVATCFVAMALVLGMAYLQEAVTSALRSVSGEGIAS